MLKKVKKRETTLDVKRQIKQGALKKYSYLIKRVGAVEFTLPQENSLNRFLFHNKPMVKVDQEGKFSQTGKLGSPKVFYIAKATYTGLIKLFEEYFIPDNLHSSLITAFLNMNFAAADATYITKFHGEYNQKMTEASTLLSLLEEFSQDKLLLKSVEFQIERQTEKHSPTKPSYGTPQTVKINGHVATQMIEKVLGNYKNVAEYSIFSTIQELNKPENKTEPFMGHKNAEKQSQSYYCWAIMHYLNKNLFNSAFSHYENQPLFQKELKRLRRLYSKNQLMLFIGRLMISAGLLKLKEDYENKDIIDNIKKKLNPHFRAKKKELENIKKNNASPIDGMVQVIPVDLLFWGNLTG